MLGRQRYPVVVMALVSRHITQSTLERLPLRRSIIQWIADLDAFMGMQLYLAFVVDTGMN